MSGILFYKQCLGVDIDEAFPYFNGILISWLILVFFPTNKSLMKIAFYIALLYALTYTIGFACQMKYDEPLNPMSLTTLEGWSKLFSARSAVFIGYNHYVVIDWLVGRNIVVHAHSRGISTTLHYLVIVPILFMTLMAAPFGVLCFFLVSFVLPVTRVRTFSKDE